MAGAAATGIDLTADKGPRIVGSIITLMILPTIFVLARLISRRVSRAGFWWDDYIVCAACCLSYLPCICVLLLERRDNLGKHIHAVKDPESNASGFFHTLYYWLIAYDAACSVNKLGIIAFYRSIFPLRQINIALVIATAVVIAHFLASIALAIFTCIPIRHFWNQEVPGKCIGTRFSLVLPGAINCVLDFFIIFLPIPLLWRLRTTASQKRVLTGIFICAGFVCVVSIIRLATLSHIGESDYTWDFINTAICSDAEPSMGVVSACLPSLRPLIFIITRGTSRAFGASANTESANAPEYSSSGLRTWRSKRSGDEDGEGPFLRLDDIVGRGDIIAGSKDRPPQYGRKISATGGKTMRAGEDGGEEMSLEESERPSGAIRVKNEVTITYSDWVMDYKHEVF